MNDSEVEQAVYDYIVSAYLFKAVERDRRHLDVLKLSRPWDALFEQVFLLAEQEYIRDRKRLRKLGCRIVIEEVLNDKHIHVMYVHRRYERHCYLMPLVLKARCEEKLGVLLQRLTSRTKHVFRE